MRKMRKGHFKYIAIRWKKYCFRQKKKEENPRDKDFLKCVRIFILHTRTLGVVL